ncbi:MAG: twin-arginine translocase TatA/TatE family subunit [Acidobacteria bacterium]|nr:twin-arginine translocase TatA/TatE family subunit [Acidobacteriota bacterium]
MDLSFTEMLVLAVLGLLIFGPQRLPGIARNVGKAFRAFQQETTRAMAELRAATDLEEKGTPDAGATAGISLWQRGASRWAGPPAEQTAPAPAEPGGVAPAEQAVSPPAEGKPEAAPGSAGPRVFEDT